MRKSRTTTDTSPSGLLLIAKSPISSYSNSSIAMQKFSVYQLPSVQSVDTAARGHTFCVRLYSLIFHPGFTKFKFFHQQQLDERRFPRFACTHTRSILRQLIFKSSSYFEFSLHPQLINPSTVDCQIFLLFRIFLAPTLDQSFKS